MYRRDISSVIRFIGIVLLLFIVFHLWFKPAPSTTPASGPDVPPDPQFLIDERVLPSEHRALPEVPQTRLIDPGNAPSAQLQKIQDNLDRGHYGEVETVLRKASPTLLTNKRTRQFAAALWNNLGVQQEKFSGVEVSVKAFKQAVALAPQNPVALLNLAQAYWALRDEALTPAFLESVLVVAPDDAFSHIALADLLIEQGNAGGAEQHLTLAQARAKADPDLAAYFQRLSGKLGHRAVSKQSEPTPVSTTPKTVPSPSVPAKPGPEPPPAVAQKPPIVPSPPAASERSSGRPTPHNNEQFAIQFDGKPDSEAAMRIRSILDYAHEDMSKRFGYTPTAAIQVVLHTNRKFAAYAASPEGADELYHHGSATIHLPMDGAMEDLAILSRVLRHQFAHALFHDKMRAHMDQVPTWLVEGLAIQLAEDPWPALEEAKQRPVSMIPLSSLEKGWDRTQRDKLEHAYLESAVAVQSLLDRFGMYGIRQVMNLLQAGQSLDGAMKQKWSLSYEQFQREWAQSGAASAKGE